VELTLGARMVAEDRNAAVVGGISLPLPLWDRRRESVDALDAQVRVAEREAASQVFLLGQQVDRLIAELDRHRAELLLLEEKVLPEMEANLGLFQEGFAMGRFTILEMLETQRSLFELRERILTARIALQTAVLELEFLTGVRLESEAQK
jgi:outer membrane protein, heavy metal efflux system